MAWSGANVFTTKCSNYSLKEYSPSLLIALFSCIILKIPKTFAIHVVQFQQNKKLQTIIPKFKQLKTNQPRWIIKVWNSIYPQSSKCRIYENNDIIKKWKLQNEKIILYLNRNQIIFVHELGLFMTLNTIMTKFH